MHCRGQHRTLVVWTNRQVRCILARVKLQFALKLPIEFRRAGTDLWLSGYTENMSATAVLFRSAGWIEPESHIEMVFRMVGAEPCRVVCSGTVIRVDLPETANAPPVISATIDQYSFVR